VHSRKSMKERCLDVLSHVMWVPFLRTDNTSPHLTSIVLQIPICSELEMVHHLSSSSAFGEMLQPPQSPQLSRQRSALLSLIELSEVWSRQPHLCLENLRSFSTHFEDGKLSAQATNIFGNSERILFHIQFKMSD
jgi:hypothetical protein